MRKLIILLIYVLIFVSCANRDNKLLNTESPDNNIYSSKQQETSEYNDVQNNMKSNSLSFIYNYFKILSEEYPPPLGVREDLIELYNCFDYNNDGINDYIVAYELYMKFIFVIFEGVTKEIIYETNVMMAFIPELTQTIIYLNKNSDVLFLFSKRYSQVGADTLKSETIQICGKNMFEIFEATYTLDDEFFHAYDKYQTEEEYVSAYTCLINDYFFLENILFEPIDSFIILTPITETTDNPITSETVNEETMINPEKITLFADWQRAYSS